MESSPQITAPSCLYCNGPIVFSNEYQKWYCAHCQRYLGYFAHLYKVPSNKAIIAAGVAILVVLGGILPSAVIYVWVMSLSSTGVVYTEESHETVEILNLDIDDDPFGSGTTGNPGFFRIENTGDSRIDLTDYTMKVGPKGESLRIFDWDECWNDTTLDKTKFDVGEVAVIDNCLAKTGDNWGWHPSKAEALNGDEYTVKFYDYDLNPVLEKEFTYKYF